MLRHSLLNAAMVMWDRVDSSMLNAQKICFAFLRIISLALGCIYNAE